MTDDLIERIWREAPEEQPMSQAQLTAVLEPRVARSSRRLNAYVWTFLLVQLATLIMASVNLVGYRSNAIMLGAETGLIVLALAFTAYGVHVHGEIRRLERMDETLETALRRRLAFYSSNASVWMWTAAFSLVTLNLAISTLIDNVDGHFPINNPLLVIGLQIAVVLITVAGFSMTHKPHLTELRAVLSDLEAQVLDRTVAVDDELAQGKRWRIVLVALLAAALALGAWVAWQSYS